MWSRSISGTTLRRPRQTLGRSLASAGVAEEAGLEVGGGPSDSEKVGRFLDGQEGWEVLGKCGHGYSFLPTYIPVVGGRASSREVCLVVN